MAIAMIYIPGLSRPSEGDLNIFSRFNIIGFDIVSDTRSYDTKVVMWYLTRSRTGEDIQISISPSLGRDGPGI